MLTPGQPIRRRVTLSKLVRRAQNTALHDVHAICWLPTAEQDVAFFSEDAGEVWNEVDELAGEGGDGHVAGLRFGTW